MPPLTHYSLSILGAAYAALAVNAALKRRRLTARAGAYVTEVVFGTLRQRGTIDWMLAQCSDRPLESLHPTVRNVLRLASTKFALCDCSRPRRLSRGGQFGQAAETAAGGGVCQCHLPGGIAPPRSGRLVMAVTGRRSGDGFECVDLPSRAGSSLAGSNVSVWKRRSGCARRIATTHRRCTSVPIRSKRHAAIWPDAGRRRSRCTAGTVGARGVARTRPRTVDRQCGVSSGAVRRCKTKETACRPRAQHRNRVNALSTFAPLRAAKDDPPRPTDGQPRTSYRDRHPQV